MKRAIITLLSTLIAGYVALVFGRGEQLDHIPEYGPIVAIAVAAGLVVYLTKKTSTRKAYYK